MLSQDPFNRAAFRQQSLRGVVCLSITGEIDLSNATDLSAQLQAAAESDGRGVILDLRELRYIDSSGIKVLVKAHLDARGAGGQIVLAAATANVQRLLTITGLDGLMPMFPTIEEALNSISPDRSTST